MDLQISVFLLFVLFTAGHSLRCYGCYSETGSCTGSQTETTCPSTWCKSIVTTSVVGDVTIKTRSKGCASECQSVSSNFGYERMNVSCCNTDLCNAQDLSDPVPNGKKCYTCDEKGCSKTLSCLGDEDRCITITGHSQGLLSVVKGCVSKSACAATALVKNVRGISCCEGNLCNGAQSVTQSFLFLCGSLLSYFLMH
ncbi:phospholipase A2 inhibitor CNF-like [Pimephales promelas]|uniref:phospholipase A2 inhibitor CNF-like n=1 Tax=Pimephales promelas TaxID=90988 RepID=UPI001955E15B|nr:phospholipase A2 inhibitor CNF-like [Pimephales promelas]KAG1941243.1 hypothetical protein F2P79_016096 [Pimephales promelas]